MSNDFIPFAVGGSANVTPQATYAANTTLTQGGFQSGLAKSPDLNKVWRQSSIMAAVLAQFIVDQSGQNAVDDGTTATLEANLLAAIKNATKQTVILTDTGVANAYTAANTPALSALPSTGYVQRLNIAHANTGASTYAPDGLAAKPIYGLGLQPLQGGELPVGVVVLMYLVQAGVNSGNGAWIIIESLGGAQQIPAATQSQHAVQMGQAAGVVGSVRNLVSTVSAASSTKAVSADEIIVETALGGTRFCLASFSGTGNLATTGVNGMDTGSAPASGYVAEYAIYNPTTGAKGLLYQNVTSIFAPNVYGGANAPAGYTHSALLTVWPTNASGQFTVGFQRDRRHYIIAQVAFTSAPATSYTAVSLSAIVPKNAISVGGTIDFTGTSGVIIAYLAGDVSGTGEAHASFNGGQGASCPFRDVPLIAQQTIFRALSGTGSSQTVYISEYDI